MTVYSSKTANEHLKDIIWYYQLQESPTIYEIVYHTFTYSYHIMTGMGVIQQQDMASRRP